MSTKNKPSYWKKIVVYLAVALTTSAAIAYAVLFNVTLTDIVSISDDASLRQAAKDSLLATDNAYPNNQNAADNLLPADNAYPNNQNAADNLLPADNTYPNNQNAADNAGLSDSTELKHPAKDSLTLTAFASRNFVIDISDNLALTDQTSGQGEVPDLPEPEEQDDRRGGGKPDRVVFEEPYFDTHPQSRIEIRSLNIVDPDNDSVLLGLKAGEEVRISVTVRNYQANSQNCVLVAQITDRDGVAVEISLEPGIVAGGNAAEIGHSWSVERPGDYNIEVMVWDGNLLSPSLLSESTNLAVTVS